MGVILLLTDSFYPKITSKILKTALFNFIKKDTFILLHLFFKIVYKINLLEMASVHIQAPLHSTFSKTSSNSTIMLEIFEMNRQFSM